MKLAHMLMGMPLMFVLAAGAQTSTPSNPD